MTATPSACRTNSLSCAAAPPARSKTWSEEARQAARLRAKAHTPSRFSTGPRTSRGKAKSRMNAYKHGHYSAAHKAEMRSIRALLNLMELRLQVVREMQHLQKEAKKFAKKFFPSNELSSGPLKTGKKENASRSISRILYLLRDENHSSGICVAANL